MVFTRQQTSLQEIIDQWFDLYADDVYRFSLSLIGNREDARDVVQEVFLRAYKSFERFRNESSPKTWLFQIARNYTNDIYRKRRSERIYVQRYGDEIENTSVPFDTDIEMQDAITALKDSYRQVILLRFIHDLSVEETARTLHWTASKVRTTQHRALAQLKRLLGDRITFDSEFTEGR